MTPQLLLENIIEKAVQGGWEAPKSYTNYEAFYVEEGKYWIWSATYCDYYNVEKFFFDHSFAQSYWGDGKECGETIEDGPEWEITIADGTHKYLPKKNWQYHLEKLALTTPEERLSYLEEYL